MSLPLNRLCCVCVSVCVFEKSNKQISAIIHERNQWPNGIVWKNLNCRIHHWKQAIFWSRIIDIHTTYYLGFFSSSIFSFVEICFNLMWNCELRSTINEDIVVFYLKSILRVRLTIYLLRVVLIIFFFVISMNILIFWANKMLIAHLHDYHFHSILGIRYYLIKIRQQ